MVYINNMNFKLRLFICAIVIQCALLLESAHGATVTTNINTTVSVNTTNQAQLLMPHWFTTDRPTIIEAGQIFHPTPPATQQEIQPPRRSFWNLYLGMNFGFGSYRETTDVTHNTNWFPGIFARASIQDSTGGIPMFAFAQFVYQRGTYKYSGYIQDILGVRHNFSVGGLSTTKQTTTIGFGNTFSNFSVFVGAEHEIHIDSGYKNVPEFYRRTRESLFGMMGAGFKHNFNNQRSKEITIRGMYLIDGTHQSRISDAGGIWGPVGTINKNIPGAWRISADVILRHDKLWFMPYVTYTRTQATNWYHMPMAYGLSGQIQEPRNTTLEFGINIGIRF